MGFTRSQTAKQLLINRETATRYWDMTADEFENQLYSINREKLLSKYEKIIVAWLNQYPTMTAAQVCDWLKEHYQEDIKERTVSRYVKGLREKYHLKKSKHPRQYEAVAELPMGQQLQVDFGERWMHSIHGQRVNVHFAAFVLEHSRLSSELKVLTKLFKNLIPDIVIIAQLSNHPIRTLFHLFYPKIPSFSKRTLFLFLESLIILLYDRISTYAL